jgi:hypothetical protein
MIHDRIIQHVLLSGQLAGEVLTILFQLNLPAKSVFYLVLTLNKND